MISVIGTDSRHPSSCFESVCRYVQSIDIKCVRVVTSLSSHYDPTTQRWALLTPYTVVHSNTRQTTVNCLPLCHHSTMHTMQDACKRSEPWLWLTSSMCTMH